MTRPRTVAGVVLAGALSLAGGSASGAAGERNLIAQKVRLVERLLARAGAAAGQAQAHLSATILLESARAYLEVERFDLVTEALDEALRLAAEAARGAAATRAEDLALVRRRLELEEGVRTFMAAYEEAVGAPLPQLALVQRLLAESRAQAGAGDHRRAVACAVEAYDTVARELAAARANETVEHRLEFQTAAEEYDYERGRYRSSRMLVDLALVDFASGERTPSAGALADIAAQVERAERLDAEAAGLAAYGEHRDAIAVQEQATSHLLRAMAKAGFFIPR